MRTPLFRTWLPCLIPVLGWWTYGLFDLDEGFYAAVVGEMNRRGDWITPFYNGQPWFEKPILMYWFAKPSVMLFGEDLGPRLPSVLAFAGTIALVGWWCKRRFTLGAAKLAMLACASSLLVVALGRMMTADALLLFGVCATFFCFWESIVGDVRWRWLAAAALGWTVLAKGPVICAIFAVVAVWTYWREKDFRPKFRGGWLVGTLIFSLIVASWYLPAYLIHRDAFVQEFLIRQNIGRLGGGDDAHRVEGLIGLLFYVPVIAVGMAPWSWWIKKSWPKSTSLDDAELRYLARWAVVVFVLFTVSGTKLVHYVLPAIIPLCVLVSVYLARSSKKAMPIAYSSLALVSALAVVGTPIYYYLWDPQRHVELRDIARQLRGAEKRFAVLHFSKQSTSTGALALRDTSHPSLLFYLDSTVSSLNSPWYLLELQRPIAIIGRKGDIADLAFAPEVERIGVGNLVWQAVRLP